MNFFKSVFSDDPTPSDDEDSSTSQTDAADAEAEADSPNTGAWSFGDLMTTLASKSESVLETYRRDLAELGSGLKKETAVIREAASRAVEDLPASLEAGASVAQVSLESVGQAIDDIGSSMWKSTAEIISHGRDAITNLDHDSDVESDRRRSSGGDLRMYSRFEAQVRAIQGSVSTYMEDSEGYEEWKLGFAMEERAEEIAELMREENGVIGGIHDEIVPSKVDEEGFWSRYFYKVHKLKEVENARAKLVKRAISGEEEDLSWDFDDEEEVTGSSGVAEGEKSGEVVKESDDAEGVESVPRKSVSSEKSEAKSDSGKESDISIVSTQPPMVGEEDLGWDEIEDIGSGDEKKGEAVGGSTSGVDLHKRLSAAEDEEDLSRVIEDDEEEGGATKS